MYSRKVNRTEFANLLLEWKPGRKASRDLFRSQPDSPPSDGELWLCWSDEDKGADELPRLAILTDNGLADFFAWAITFLPGYRPLTSFIRVLPWTVYEAVRDQKPSGSDSNDSVLVSLILAETLTNGTGRGFVDALPMTAYETTYSYAASRALSLGYDENTLPYIYKGWQSARELDPRGRRLPGDLLLGIWSLIPQILKNGRSKVFSGDNGMTFDLLRACEEISERGQISIHSLQRLSNGRVPPHLFMEAVKTPREQRVVAFESTIRQLAFGPTAEPAINFVVGYLASLVSDGSLEHSHLVFPIQAQFPTAMLWYGMCAALSPSSRVLTDYGHLGLRILRMLERDSSLMTPPTCDISLAELEVILRGQPRSRGFRQTHASSLRIELAPGVTTLTRSIGNHSTVEQPGLFGEELRQPSVEAERLKDLVYSLRNSLSLAESILSNTNNPNGGGDTQSRSKRKR
jgi:hypothetical protein